MTLAVYSVLLACSSTPEGPRPDTPADTSEPAPPTTPAPAIDARAQIVRLSMQLAGRRPEPEWVSGEPDAARVAEVLELLLADPALGQRAAWTWNESLHTAAFAEAGSRWDEIPVSTRRALNWEPLAGVALVVAEDRPLTDLVTAQSWPANPALAELLDRPYAGVGEEWAWTPYTDGRPMAGMLSTAGLWARHAADATNFQRRRANLVAHVFVCADFFSRDVNFQLVTTDVASTAVEDAVRTDPACITCHAALDPLAGFLGGFGERSEPSALDPWLRYSPRLAEYAAAGFPPAWYGTPGSDLSDLGRFIADDPRFPRCMARRTYESLTGASFDEEPQAEALVSALVDGGFKYDALVRAVVATDAWAAEVEHPSSADQIATALSHAYGLPDAGAGVHRSLEEALFDGELRAMSGDTDDEMVLVRNSTPGAGTQLVAEWIARTALPTALAADAALPAAERQLLPRSDSPGETEHRDALAALYLRFLSREVALDGPEVERLYALFTAAGSDTQGAYGEVILALSRHPDVGLH